MKDRQQNIIRAILAIAFEIDGPVGETILHASVNLHVTPNAILTEFETALKACERDRWMIGVRGKFGGVKWSITDAGKAVHLEAQ